MITTDYIRTALKNRAVSEVFLHYSASDIDVKGQALVNTIDSWHKARGWKGIGYHFVIDKTGEVLFGRALHLIPAAQKNHNQGTIAICVHGGKHFEPIQFTKLKELCTILDVAIHPKFRGHKEVVATDCPAYDYKKILDIDPAGRLGKVESATPPTVIATNEVTAVNEETKVFWKSKRVQGAVIALVPIIADSIGVSLSEEQTSSAISGVEQLITTIGILWGLYGGVTAKTTITVK